MENIVLGFVLGASIIGFIALLMIVIRLSFIISEMATIIKSMYVSVNKIEQMSQATMQASENFVDALSEVTKDTNDTGNLHFIKMFGSADGKHIAPTVDGLIEKMKRDPNYQQMSDKDIEEIRKLFEDNAEDDDDDDQPNEPWK